MSQTAFNRMEISTRLPRPALYRQHLALHTPFLMSCRFLMGTKVLQSWNLSEV